MNPDAKFICDKQTVKLDPVWRSELNLTFDFNIKNGGTADLQIRANGRSDRTIKPGETELLSVKINCHKLKGKFTRPISVDTNDPSNPLVTLNCAGEILESAVAEPPQINFGVISRASPTAADQKVTITGGSSGPITPKLKEFSIPGVEAALVEVEPGKKWELTAKLTDTKAAPRVHGDFEIETGVAQAPVLKVPIFAMLAPRATAEPRSVIVPKDRDGKWQQVVKIVWDGPEPGHITAAQSDDPGVIAEVQGKEGEPQGVVVKIAEGFKPTARNYAVIIDTSDPEMAQLTVPLRFMEMSSTRPPRPPAGRQPVRNPNVSEPAKPPQRPPASGPKAVGPASPSMPVQPKPEGKADESKPSPPPGEVKQPSN
jgi:hypothetical protein